MKTQIALLVKVIEERITTTWSDPAPSSQLESPLHLTQSKITQRCLQRETNSTSLQITKFQPLDLWDEGSIYRYLQGVSQLLGF